MKTFVTTGLDYLPSEEARQVSHAFTGSWMPHTLSKESGHPGYHSPIDQGRVAICAGGKSAFTLLVKVCSFMVADRRWAKMQTMRRL